MPHLLGALTLPDLLDALGEDVAELYCVMLRESAEGPEEVAALLGRQGWSAAAIAQFFDRYMPELAEQKRA